MKVGGYEGGEDARGIGRGEEYYQNIVYENSLNKKY